jgi:hypothetical protein
MLELVGILTELETLNNMYAQLHKHISNLTVNDENRNQVLRTYREIKEKMASVEEKYRSLVKHKHPKLIVATAEVINYYTVYKTTGERLVISGDNIANALKYNGLGSTMSVFIDWYDHGVTETHEFDSKRKSWYPKVIKNQPTLVHHSV